MNFIASTKELSSLVESEIYNNNLNTSASSFMKTDSIIIGISGASGFLGLHLIEQLVKDPQVKKIKCFIRNRNKFNAKKKEFQLNFLEDKLEFYEDLKPESFADITNFIHSAAQLHSLKNVKQLWEPNVLLTQQLLKLVKGRFHYISTLSLFASSNKQSKTQYCLPDKDHLLYGGYAQSKWISEYLTGSYSDHQILRLGLLTPSHHNPVFQSHEFFYLFIKLMKTLGIHPEKYEEAFVDMSPVDDVAKIIASEIKGDKTIVHIANKNSTSLSSILKEMDTKPVSREIWNETINSLKKTEQVLLNYTFFKTEALKEYFQYYNIDLFQSTGHYWHGNIACDTMSQCLGNVNV